MKKLKLIITGLAMAVLVSAQSTDSSIVEKNHEIGFHVGSTTGIGLSYRYWPKNLGIQITMLPVKDYEVTSVNLGVTGLYNFYHARRVRFFGYLANNLLYRKNKNYTSYYNPNTGNYTSYYKTVETTKYNVGFGPGFGFGTRVRLNIMAGYGFYDVFNQFDIYPTGEIGLYFRL